MFKIEKYAAGNHLAFHLLERFFRIINESIGKDTKHKARGVEYNVSLDDMIKDSDQVGFPKHLIRFFRYFFTRIDGIISQRPCMTPTAFL